MSIFSTKRRDGDVTATPTPKTAAPRSSARNAPAASSQENTHIAAGSRVVGEISGAAELVIDGEVEGQIDLDSLVVVGPNGRVEGEIHAKAVQVSGKMVGNIRGRDRVEVKASGRLEGDVVAPRVVIDDGAFFKGKVEMTGEKGAEKAAAKPSVRPEQRKSGNGGQKSPSKEKGGAPQGGAPSSSGGDRKGGRPGK